MADKTTRLRYTKLRLEKISAVDRPAQEGAVVVIAKRAFSADERKKLAESGAAMPDGSYPIENKNDLRNAIQAIGRAKSPGAAAAHIKRRARALGALDMLPETGVLAVAKSADGSVDESQFNDAGGVSKAISGYEKPAMTNEVRGHVHLLELNTTAGQTSYATSDPPSMTSNSSGASSVSYSSAHAHSYIVDSKGDVTIGVADGHTHTVAVKAIKSDVAKGDAETNSKTSENGNMEATATETKKNDADRISVLESELETAKALASMNDAQRAYHAKLSKSDAIAFEKMAPSERESTVAKSLERDRVVYKSVDGTEFRASDDPRLVAMAKRADESARELATEKALREVEVYKRRAETELAHLPGTVETRVALLKSVDSIPDATERANALKALHANNTSMAEAFKRKGGKPAAEDSDDDEDDPQDKIDAKVSKIATEKGITFEKAMSEFLDTEEGQELYSQIETPVDSRGVGSSR